MVVSRLMKIVSPRLIRGLLLALVTVCAACVVVLRPADSSASPASSPQNSPTVEAIPSASVTARKETFEIVWRTVKEKHFDSNFNGVDWEEVHRRYAPRVETTGNDNDFYRLMTNMLGELNQSHFSIIPPSSVFDDEPETLAEKGGSVGIDVRMIGGRAVVISVSSESSAAGAGIRPGFVITRVGRIAVAQIKQKMLERKERPVLLNYRIAAQVMGRMNGEVGTEARVEYIDGINRFHTVALRRAHRDGEVMRFGELPPIIGQFESRRLPGNIGYIKFNIFLAPMMEKLQTQIRSMADTTGIIIDIRGNPGGLGIMAPGLARLFCREQISLGTMKLRRGEQNFVVFANEEAYAGPLVILVDGMSGSTSEVLAGGMQELGRAIIVGETTLGGVLPSIIEKLPIGARLQYAIADFKTPKGTLLEGRGVIPDVPVAVSRRSLLAGGDPALRVACGVILAKGAGHKTM